MELVYCLLRDQHELLIFSLRLSISTFTLFEWPGDWDETEDDHIRSYMCRRKWLRNDVQKCHLPIYYMAALLRSLIQRDFVVFFMNMFNFFFEEYWRKSFKLILVVFFFFIIKSRLTDNLFITSCFSLSFLSLMITTLVTKIMKKETIEIQVPLYNICLRLRTSV